LNDRVPDVAWRAEARERLRERRFDVVVIGGGITGAGVARDAALRGLQVALFERADFASGTSSRSSRLIHGGVRYLEHGHLRLVFEASRERRILLRIAPHLVRPLPFTWPVYEGARISRLKLALGLGLYDVLAMFRNVARHSFLSRRDVHRLEPALATESLVGGARYHDAATDDARLTLANVLAAREAGATVLNHAEVTGIARVGGRAAGVHVYDRVSDTAFAVRAAEIVNAAGPWSDDVRSLEQHASSLGVTGSAGAHIALRRDRVGNREAITMIHPVDGRVLFTLPAVDHTIVGTTETVTTPGTREIRATREDVAYLLGAANQYFPRAKLRDDDVVAAWSGIRPLAHVLEGHELGSASREHTIERGPGGVIHVTGGKLTTYRSMAEEVMDALTDGESLPNRGLTARRPLPGGETTLEASRNEAAEAIDDDELRERLVLAHGARWRDVAGEAQSLEGAFARLLPDLPVSAVEFVHGVERELAVTLGDLLIRRTGIAFLRPDHGMVIAPAVAELVAPLLGWDAEGIRNAVADYEREVEATFATQ
jgi:glycerol-3-phosphate dehydrogenase